MPLRVFFICLRSNYRATSPTAWPDSALDRGSKRVGDSVHPGRILVARGERRLREVFLE